MIDLRSDTFTRPTPEMRRAMAEAEVGDDVFGEDPTVRELEEQTAAALGKEAALYVPSGHMANQIAVYISTRSGDEIWAHRDGHVVGNEQGGTSVLARVLPRTYDSELGYPDAALLEDWARGADDVHRARPRLLCLENTFTGRIVPPSEQRRIAAFAHERGMLLHLDGARLWNAAVALGETPAKIAEDSDTVAVCFSKGLGAPVGSAVAGSAEAVAEARRARKLLGGGMRQAGIIAAGALYALRNHVDRLADDHARARHLAERISQTPPLTAEARTNMVVVTTPAGQARRYADLFAREGVICLPLGEDRLRLVVHLDVSEEEIDAAAERIAKASAAS